MNASAWIAIGIAVFGSIVVPTIVGKVLIGILQQKVNAMDETQRQHGEAIARIDQRVADHEGDITRLNVRVFNGRS